MAKKSELEEKFDKYWALLSHDVEPVAEHKFFKKRRWKFDRAFLSEKVAIEIEGGVFTGGRHSGGMGMVNDIDKYNQAMLEGWIVLRYTTKHLSDNPSGMVDQIKQALEFRRSGKDDTARQLNLRTEKDVEKESVKDVGRVGSKSTASHGNTRRRGQAI